MTGAVVVVGSLNVDLVVGVHRMPAPGETVLSTRFERHPGGKGLNQAVAAARLGARVHMIGAVGPDDSGRWLCSVARDEAIADGPIIEVAAPTGTAFIEVDDDGANRIVVVSGANAEVTPEQVRASLAAIDSPAVVLVQCEVPMPAIEAAMAAGRELGATTILNPAPACELPAGLLANVDVIIPNEHEAAAITGLPTATQVDATMAADWLNDQGVRYAVITRGSHGAVWASSAHGSGSQAAFPVRAIDTVAAGDAFCGGLATGLAEGMSFPEALRMASATGSLATTVVGAVPSLPGRAVVDAALAEH